MCSARAFTLLFVCTQRTNISLRTRVFLSKRKTAIFRTREKKCQQQHGEQQLCCKGEPRRRRSAFTRAVVVVVRRPTKAAHRLLSRRTRTRQKPCRFSFSYLQVCFVLYLIWIFFNVLRDRSVRGIGVHVATNRKLARVLREQNGKTTRHRRAREREIDARQQLVQSQSEKIFWGEE